ncbi:MAG: acyl-CoA dehydrogenase [Zetaproteobacteria bacterium]|nr:MAG: acyl-CoA dehydrogenase [Zetaproteobacteria bacterium]
MLWLVLVAFVFACLLLLARKPLPLSGWALLLAGGIGLMAICGMPLLIALMLWLLDATVYLVFARADWRLAWISRPLFARIRATLPPISDTERAALEAGDVWWERSLFCGAPDWRALHALPRPSLSEQERAFLDGPVRRLCAMLDDWDIHQRHHDLPEEVWRYLKRERFFGLIIPKAYGGLGFSAYAHSRVVQAIASRSAAAAVTVMVPNSLGPAELLLAYGTQAQKDYYLPRLARGEEIPCFALTAPEAGSDATAMKDCGVVCVREFEGKPTLGLLLNWKKRYITLGPVATVLGLAFKVYDPEHLLGEVESLGITCALIPVDTPGVVIGRRHDPMGVAFMNGPNEGHDVFIPLDWVIGGRKMIGQGWRMLVERLAVGRGISLPALSVASGKLSAETSGLYTRLRKQFHMPIGRFEGVQEALAEIAGLTYMMDATARLTTCALDQGVRPAIVTAIAKRYLTEGMRKVVNAAMDVHGGRAVCMGPSNYLARIYHAIPVAITVEGANILTRSFMIFGQGAIRCHPYLLDEMAAVAMPECEGLARFDRALRGHVAYTLRNGARSLVAAVSFGCLAPAPCTGRKARFYRQLARFSAAIAVMSDLALLALGGGMKRREFLSGRFADALAYGLMCAAVLKRFRDDGEPADDWPLVEWSCAHALYHMQQALYGVMRNFPVRPVALLMRLLVFPLGRTLAPPTDRMTHKVATLLLEQEEVRKRLSEGIYADDDAHGLLGRLRHAWVLTRKAEPIERRLREAGCRWDGGIQYEKWIAGLKEQGQLSEEEAGLLVQARKAMLEAIAVDDFAPDFWMAPQ